MFGIITAILTVLGAIIGVIITLLAKYFKDRKVKRVSPTFVIGNDEVDDIDSKLKINNDYWFVDLDNIEDLVKKKHYYFYFSVLKNYCLFESKIAYQVTRTDDSKSPKNLEFYEFGTILPQKGYMLPIEKMGNEARIEIVLSYKNENNEKIKYTLVANIDTDKKRFKTITETSYIIKGKNREKEILSYSKNMSKMNSAKAISIKLNNRTLNKTGEQNGNNNSSLSI